MIKIIGITLLSTEEAKKFLTRSERAYNNWWWLRSPCSSRYRATYVNSEGYIFYNSTYVDSSYGCVRPALIIDISNSDVKFGDVFEFGGKEFKVISPDLAWMHNDDLCASPYRVDSDAEDANNFGSSDIKLFLDEWFEVNNI